MPILIILLFYANDLVRIRRYYSQTEFVAQQMVNMIQNISQKRGNKRITAQDLRYISCAANLSIYPSVSMFKQTNGLILGHAPQTFVHCVKGLSGGKASHIWYVQTCFYSHNSPSTLWGNINSNTSNSWTSVGTIQTNVSPSQIHPSLKIQEGEVKIIVESFLHYQSHFKNADGVTVNSAKKAFGLFFVNPKAYARDEVGYFTSVSIFTPKPGIFAPNNPPS